MHKSIEKEFLFTFKALIFHNKSIPVKINVQNSESKVQEEKRKHRKQKAMEDKPLHLKINSAGEIGGSIDYIHKNMIKDTFKDTRV
jgi:hypothetical protein